MKKALLIYAHPNAPASRANRRLVDELRQIPNLTCHSLYEQYPEFYLDVPREKELLREHQLIIWQHPFYWYSMPPLMKLWLDQVLEYNFAYGPEGGALRGKQALLSLTVGGARASYREGEQHGRDISAYLAPYEQVARFCGMEWLNPQILFESLNANEAELGAYAGRLRALVEDVTRISAPAGES